MIDSGWASPDALNRKLFAKVNSMLPVDKENGDKLFLAKSKMVVNVVEKYSVGSFEYKNIIFQKNNEPILGLQFLSRHLVTFDFPNNMMYLKKGKNFDKQQQIRIALGQTGCTINAENHEVVKVDPNGSAYKKGFREKDVLIKSNDFDVSPLNTVEFINLLSQVSVLEKGKVSFAVKRGDEIFTVEFDRKRRIENED